MALVCLKASVFHDGRYRRAGHVLDVPQAEANRLVGLGVAVLVGTVKVDLAGKVSLDVETAFLAQPETAMMASGRPRKR